MPFQPEWSLPCGGSSPSSWYRPTQLTWYIVIVTNTIIYIKSITIVIIIIIFKNIITLLFCLGGFSNSWENGKSHWVSRRFSQVSVVIIIVWSSLWWYHHHCHHCHHRHHCHHHHHDYHSLCAGRQRSNMGRWVGEALLHSSEWVATIKVWPSSSPSYGSSENPHRHREHQS